MTLVDRHTGCILSWRVSGERTQEQLQAMVDEAPQATYYYSDLFATYRVLIYMTGVHTPMPDKSETHCVKADNAELRHYLVRLARWSKCFSCCIDALRRAIKLLIYVWNRRQIYHSQYPKYPCNVKDFVYP